MRMRPRAAGRERPPRNEQVEQTVNDSASRSRQATALAELSVADAEARLVLDWTAPLNHAAFYKAVYRPAVLRANRLTPTAALPRRWNSTHYDTRTRACVLRRAGHRWRSRDSWGTRKSLRHSASTPTCSSPTTMPTRWPRWAPWRRRRTGDERCTAVGLDRLDEPLRLHPALAFVCDVHMVAIHVYFAVRIHPTQSCR